MPSLHPYPSYRKTDLPWLGGIPAHWEAKRLKHVADVAFSSVDKHSNEDEKLVSLCNYVDVYKNDQITSELEFMQATASADEIRKFTLKKDDVMITKDSESWNDIAVPAYVPSDMENVLCGYHLALVRPNPNEVDGKFLFHALQARPINYQFEVEATGITRYGIDQYAIGSAFFPVPPLPEQQAIAAYLDRQTAKIDALIARKERLLDLLAEQRAALISQAVTKGLPPSPRGRGVGGEVKMKDSGVAWLGQVPSHWKVKPLKYTVLLNPETLTEKTDPDYVIQYLDISNVDELEGIGEVQEIRFENAPSRARRIVRAGDTIISTVRTYLKAVAYFENPPPNLIVSTGFAILRPKRDVHPKYLSWLIQSKPFIEKVVTHSVGVGYPAINPSELASLKVWLPPISEQIAISDYLDYRTKRLTDLAAKVGTAIERLREYRAALISSVVTGKIKVKDEG